MKPEELRAEILRLEEERLRLASEVIGGDPAAVEEDRRLGNRLRELAGAEREARTSELMAAWRWRRSGEGDDAKDRTSRGGTN